MKLTNSNNKRHVLQGLVSVASMLTKLYGFETIDKPSEHFYSVEPIASVPGITNGSIIVNDRSGNYRLTVRAPGNAWLVAVEYDETGTFSESQVFYEDGILQLTKIKDLVDSEILRLLIIEASEKVRASKTPLMDLSVESFENVLLTVGAKLSEKYDYSIQEKPDDLIFYSVQSSSQGRVVISDRGESYLILIQTPNLEAAFNISFSKSGNYLDSVAFSGEAALLLVEVKDLISSELNKLVSNTIRVQYTSIWEAGTVNTNASLNLLTGEVFDIESTDCCDCGNMLESEEIYIKEADISLDVLPDFNGFEYAINIDDYDEETNIAYKKLLEA